MAKKGTRALRYLAVGVANTITDFGLFNLLVYLSNSPGTGLLFLFNVISIAFATGQSFILHRSWTFPHSEKKPFQKSRFLLITILGIGFNSLVILVFAKLGFRGIWFINGSKVLAALLIVGWKYWAYQHWVFGSFQKLESFSEEGKAGLVSVIIPAFNEEKRLAARLSSLTETLPSYFPTELIIVDDGSEDETFLIAESFKEEYPFVRVFSLATNCGKGAAVRAGMQAARGEYLVFVDADRTFTPQQIKEVVNALEGEGEMVIGCRKGVVRLQGESVIRRVLGACFNFFVRLFFLPKLEDSQCGLKGFKRATAKALFSKQKLSGFAFDVELLALAKALKLTVIELPLTAKAAPGSKVTWQGALLMLWELAKLKLNLLFNRYQLPRRGLWRGELALVLGLFLLAFAVRLPYLWEVPRFIDELGEVKLAYEIYQGVSRPLHNAARDIGAFHNYLLAGIFELFGPSIYWPRLYVALTSALTVVLLYFVGKRLFGQTVGLVAAFLLLGSGMHILVTHMAWSNSTTPFFFTLALYLTLWAQEREDLLSSALVGLCWGLALQTHASIIVSVLAVAIYLLREKTAYNKLLAQGIGFFVGYGNMIYFNLSSGFGSISWLGRKTYTLEQNPSLGVFFQNAGKMTIQFIRTISSTYLELENPWVYLAQPQFLLIVLALILGLYYSRRVSSPLPWLLISGFLVIPWLNHRFGFYLPTRYIMPQVLVGILLAAVGLVQGGRFLVRKGFARQYLWGLGAMVLALQLLPHYQYCESLKGTNHANTTALAIIKAVQEEGRGLVFLDPTLPIENDPLPVLFNLKGQPYLQLEDEALAATGSSPKLLVLSEENYLKRAKLEPFEVIRKFNSPTINGKERIIYLVELDDLKDERPVSGSS